MIVRVYLAAPLARWAVADTTAQALRARGAIITSGWHLRQPGQESALGLGDRYEIAKTNRWGVRASTHVLLIADSACRGSLVEAGMAIGMRRQLVVFGEQTEHTLMLESPWTQFVPTLEAALDVVCPKGVF